MKHLNPLNIFSFGFDILLSDSATSGCNPPTDYCGTRDCRQPCSGCSDTYKWSCDVDNCNNGIKDACPSGQTDKPCMTEDRCYLADHSTCNKPSGDKCDNLDFKDKCTSAESCGRFVIVTGPMGNIEIVRIPD